MVYKEGISKTGLILKMPLTACQSFLQDKKKKMQLTLISNAMLHNTVFHRFLAEIFQLFLHNFEESEYSEYPSDKGDFFSA